jgi:nitroreductase
MAAQPGDVWRIAEQDFPRTDSIERQLRFLVRYAILAPSTRNTQPWRFVVTTSTVRLLADLEREQAVADPRRRELYISLGCALENLLVAGEHFGLRHEVRYFPEPGNEQLVAGVAFEPGEMQSPARAGIPLDAIARRYNDNGVYRPAALTDDMRRKLEACRLESELRLDLTDDHLFHRWVEQLTQEADRLEFADPGFREELGCRIREGAFGLPKVLSRLGSLAVSRLDLGDAVSRQDQKIVDSAPLLGLISASGDTHLAQVRSGQLFERLWLTATAMGVSVHPMSQTMRHPDIRSAMAELIPARGWVPQHLFRVGYSLRQGDPWHHTPRRPLEEVLRSEEDGRQTHDL